MTFTWTSNTPLASDFLSNSQEVFRQNNNYMGIATAVDHNMGNAQTTTGPGQTTGMHNQVSFTNRNSTTLAIPPLASAFIYGSNGDMFWRSNNINQANPAVMTRADKFTNADDWNRFCTNTNYNATFNGGWTFLPGGVILQWISGTTTGAVTTIPWPVPFATLFATVSDGITTTSSSTNNDAKIAIFPVAATVFRVFGIGV